jgi:IS5 family transposase
MIRDRTLQTRVGGGKVPDAKTMGRWGVAVGPQAIERVHARMVAMARIFRGETRTEGKILSLFEPSTEVIRKGKAAKPNEFGKMVKLQEAENQIVIDYAVYARRPNDADLLLPAIEAHRAKLGRAPYLVAADAAFCSARNEAAAKAKGIKRVCIPNRSTKSAERRREQKKRWFRNGQKWRTGCEGRISVIKRRHGLIRCRYKGEVGMQRWVGLGVIAAGRRERDKSCRTSHPMCRAGRNDNTPSTRGNPRPQPGIVELARWSVGRSARHSRSLGPRLSLRAQLDRLRSLQPAQISDRARMGRRRSLLCSVRLSHHRHPL